MQPNLAARSFPVPSAPTEERPGSERIAGSPPHHAPLPDLRFGTEPVNAPALRAAGTGLWMTLACLGAVGAAILVAATTMGIGLIAFLVAPVVDFFRARKVRALIHGTGLQVGPQQLPQIHACVEEFARRLDLKDPPGVYVVEDSVQNGFAMKIGRKNVVLLTDDIVWGSLHARDPRALGFVIGHELAHVALGHTGTFRSTLRMVMRPLSRLDELSADNVARRLVGDDRVAFEGVKLLLVGPQLSAHVNDEALIAQAREVAANRLSKKAERNLTHPLIMRRVANLLG